MSSFAVTKLLSLLVYPLSLSMLLCVLALCFLGLRWPRRAFYTALVGIVWLYLCSTSFFANFLMGSLERDIVSRAMSVVEKADAIVLLGGAMRGDTHRGTLPDLNQQADRLVHAVALYKAGKAPIIVLSGGGASGNRTEAEQMRDVLAVMGVPARDMVLEIESRDTHDNSVFTTNLLKGMKKRHILLVTSAFHMRRARGAFLAQGLNVVPAPTDFQQLVTQQEQLLPVWIPLPRVANLFKTTHALHEIVGYWVYRWRGWL